MGKVTFTTKGYIEVWYLAPSPTFVSRHRQETEAVESATAYADTLGAGIHEFELRYPSKNVKVFGVLNPLQGDTTPPTVPGNPSLVSISASTVTFSWSASTDNVGVTGYQILRGGSPIATTTQTSYTDSGLTPSTAYSYSVQAYDAAGNNSGTTGQSPLSVTTNANASPAWNVSTQELTTGDAYNLSLTSVCSDADTDPLTFSIVSGTLPTGIVFNGTNKTVSGTPSAVGTSVVTFRVTDSIVNVDQAITFEVLDADATAPSAPVLTATASSSTSIGLSWTASTDTAGANERASGVASYRVYRGGQLRATVTAPTVTYSDTGLSTSTTHEYYVQAVDVAGNVSVASNTASVYLPGAVWAIADSPYSIPSSGWSTGSTPISGTGATYSLAQHVTVLTGTPSYSITSGSETGISINPTTGLLTIGPTAAASSYSLVVGLSDGVNPATNRTFGFTVQAVVQPPVDDFVPLRTLYVNAATGNDSWDGLYATYQGGTSGPWATVGRAARGSTNWAAPVPSQAAQPGDLVMVASGIYWEDGYRGANASDMKSSVACNPANSGTAAHPIKFQGVGLPQLRMQQNARGGVIGANGRSYIIWDGFDIDDYYCGSASDFGPVIFTALASYCTIKNCRVQGHPGSYYWGYPTFEGNYRLIACEDTSYLTVRNNKISRARRANNTPGGQNEGGVLSYSLANGLIENNTFSDCGTAVFIKGQKQFPQSNNVIRKNLVYECPFGIRMLDAFDNYVYQNVVRNSTSEQGIWLGSGAVPGIVVANNTIVGNPYGIWFQNAAAPLGVIGNIFVSNSYALRFGDGSLSASAVASIGTTNRNCYFGNSNFADYGTTYAAWQGLGEDLQSSTANPLFVNAAAYDYRLQAGSPVRTLSRDVYSLFGGDANTAIPAGAYITGTEQIGADW